MKERKDDEKWDVNDSYCMAAFTHIYTDTASRYKLCCYANRFHPISISAENVLPFDFFFGGKMKKIREDMLRNRRRPECSFCYGLERRGIDSPRNWRYNQQAPFHKLRDANGKRQKNFPTEVKEHSIELKLRIFGNQCNLSCYMCVPRNSSTRGKEMEAIGMHDVFGYEKIQYDEITISNERYDEMVEHLIKYHKYIRTLTILGGEPFVMPRVKDFLTRLPNPDRKIHLVFNTNLAQIAWLPEFHKKFPNLTLIVSCDHYGDKLAWLRYPIKVDKFEDNLRRAKELSKYMAIACTISRLNVPDMREIYEYYRDNFDIGVGYNTVHYPPHLSAKQLSHEQKAIVIGRLKDWIHDIVNIRNTTGATEIIPRRRYQAPDDINSLKDIIKVISEPADPNLNEAFYDYIDKLDKHRNTDARALFGNWI